MTAGLLTGSTGGANNFASLHYTLGHEPYLARKESLWIDARGCFEGALLCFEGSTHEVETAVDV